jgi:hypothetical protein
LLFALYTSASIAVSFVVIFDALVYSTPIALVLSVAISEALSIISA